MSGPGDTVTGTLCAVAECRASNNGPTAADPVAAASVALWMVAPADEGRPKLSDCAAAATVAAGVMLWAAAPASDGGARLTS